MKKFLLISGVFGTLFFTTPIMAQNPGDVTLTVNQVELGLLGKGLGLLPYNDVSALFIKLQSQIAEQQKKAEKPVDKSSK